MNVIIHRGIDQIGGCITEIATAKARIIIDLGQNLPDNECNVNDVYASKEAVEELCNGIDAILYTHYHGDHLGHFLNVPDRVTQYIGATAKRVLLRKYEQLSYIPGKKAEMEAAIAKIENMEVFTECDTIEIGDIVIKPFFVSHSAYDSYMFIVEAENKRIVHTGDFRDHGYLSKNFYKAVNAYILARGTVDLLITEGTMTSRLAEEVKNEQQIQTEIGNIMRRYKNVFVLCSSTDLERLASVKAAARKQRLRSPLIADNFQKDVLAIFTGSLAAKSPMWNFGTVYDFRESNGKLIRWMLDAGFCMFVRPTDKFNGYLDSILPRLNPQETVLVYSMWKEYVNPGNPIHRKDNYLKFIDRFANVEKIHTSGHASPECLARVCNQINPTIGIIPIHSENSANFSNLPIHEELKQRIITSSANVGGIEIVIKDKEVLRAKYNLTK